MPRPVFDINEYELRGLVPDVYTLEQKKLLNETLSRVNGQADWTAQMLGFNGPGYWGRPNPKADGSYNWVGLPETMNEKRQMQVGAFGVFNKHLPYEQWPAPFNRTDIKASGDAKFHVFVENGKTELCPVGHGEQLNYSHDSVLFAGATYLFDSEIDFSVAGASLEDALFVTTYFVENVRWTRIKVKDTNAVLGIKAKGSEAREAFMQVVPWQDASDWDYAQVGKQFIGLWGNKGASISFDAAFDSLDLHGFDERFALTLEDQTTSFTLQELMAKVGLEQTEWTEYLPMNFGFRVGDCDLVYPVLPFDPGDLYDNDLYDRLVQPTDSQLTDGTFDSMPPSDSVSDSGEYEKPLVVIEPDIPDPFNFATCEDCNYDVVMSQTLSDSFTNGIGSITFKYEAKTDCGLVDFPCVEWVFDPTLDDGEYERSLLFPAVLGPWATVDDGRYDDVFATPPVSYNNDFFDRQVLPSDSYLTDGTFDNPAPASNFVFEGIYDRNPNGGMTDLPGSIIESPDCFEGVSQGEGGCPDSVWCGFDDGEFDEPVEPNCDAPITVGCSEADGGFYTIAGPPDYEDCECGGFECCLIDNGPYINGVAYLGPEKADGGEYTFFGPCIIYDNGDWDSAVVPVCILDNGNLESEITPNSVANSREFDRTLVGCEPCTAESQDGSALCPVQPLNVQLIEVFADSAWSMEPAISNAVTPLRLWKSHVLMVTDEVPNEATDHNYLVADQNKGPEPFDSYRHFVRLPLEYPRGGKDWNRAEAVCNNQSYFSAPPQLSQTDATPIPLRPLLYSEAYGDFDEKEYSLFYEEGFLCSSRKEDYSEVQDGFSDATFTFEVDTNSAFALAVITEYDAFEVRTPHENGEWRGSYYKIGTNNSRTGFLQRDLDDQHLVEVPYEDFPVFDMSVLKLPNVEFPDAIDSAAMKNYVVSYAYFAADFSASDDPVFDPDKKQCWRKETIACETDADCSSYAPSTNTAYLLHSS
tara:strand:+ start:13357 stop:16293 length:2937 start_codon:yes stop_codon:yes gene_type:complete